MRTLTTLLLLSLGLSTLATARPPREREFSVLVVPATHGSIQIARDFEELASLLIVSYDPAAPAETPFLHTWNGAEWLRLRPEAYLSGNFLRQDPARVIVVGPPGSHVSSLVEQATLWSRREVLNIESSDPVEVINALGRIFDIRPRDWRWFADRYVLELEDLNRDIEHVSWYDAYKASDLPPATSPFRRRRAPTEPEAGLQPLITLESVEEVTPAPAPEPAPEPAPAPVPEPGPIPEAPPAEIQPETPPELPEAPDTQEPAPAPAPEPEATPEPLPEN